MKPRPEDDNSELTLPTSQTILKWLSVAQKPLLLISMFALVLHSISLVVFAFINGNIQDFFYILPTLVGFTLSLINIKSESFKKLLSQDLYIGLKILFTLLITATLCYAGYDFINTIRYAISQ